MQIGGQQIDFIQFNIIRQWEQNGDFKVDRFVTKTDIIDDHAFEAMNFGQDSYCYTLFLKCIRKQTYLKAIDFANTTRKLTIAEDILASMAILGVSKMIALLDCALYYYCYNGDSATRAIEPRKVQERIENLNFVISKFKEIANKKDEQYKVFMEGMCKILATHIVSNKTQMFMDTYQRRLKSGYPKWLARLILSLQRKPLGFNKNKRDLHKFIKENKHIFQDFTK